MTQSPSLPKLEAITDGTLRLLVVALLHEIADEYASDSTEHRLYLLPGKSLAIANLMDTLNPLYLERGWTDLDFSESLPQFVDALDKDDAAKRKVFAGLLHQIADRTHADILTPAESETIGGFLDQMSEFWSCHGANDFDLKAVLPNVRDRQAIMQEMHERNGDPEEFDPQNPYDSVMDWILMWVCSERLKPKP